MVVACVYHTSQVNSTSLEKAPQLHIHNVQHPRVLQLAPFFGSYMMYHETLCSLHNACFSHRVQYSLFPLFACIRPSKLHLQFSISARMVPSLPASSRFGSNLRGVAHIWGWSKSSRLYPVWSTYIYTALTSRM